MAALRRSELTALTIEQVAEHANGLVLAVARSKTNQTGERADLAGPTRASVAAPLNESDLSGVKPVGEGPNVVTGC